MTEDASSSGYDSVAIGRRGRSLSRREEEIVCLLFQGDRVPLIARQLWLTQGTVRKPPLFGLPQVRVKSQQELIVLLRDIRSLGNRASEPDARETAKRGIDLGGHIGGLGCRRVESDAPAP